MKCLIVYAHPEERSFNGSMKNLAVSTLQEQGWQVKVSDLYKMQFNPVAGRQDFLELENTAYLNIIMEQKHASTKALFNRDIREEQEKVLWADFIILQFPVWWFSVPAILKGWFDRVLATGFAWDFGRMYDKGLLAGKKAMSVVTTGGPADFYLPEGPHGQTIEQVLFNVNHGTLFFCGFEVIPPFTAYSVFQAGNEKREEYLRGYKQRLMNMNTVAPLKYHPLSDFDEKYRLKT
jgi:NAD(P)H dehydrogenase (quinone)